MKDTKKIEHLIKQAKREKLNIDFTKDFRSDEVGRLLESDETLNFNKNVENTIKKHNKKEDMSDFDYFEEKEVVVQEVEEKIQEQENVVQEEKVKNKKVEIQYDDTKIDKSQAPIIRFEKVELSYDGVNIIKDITLDIFPGEFVYFVGPSGAGKSSLVKMIYRDVKNENGKILVDGTNISNIKTSKLPMLRRKIGVIFQDYKLLNNRTVYDNVNYSLEVTGYPKKKRKEQVLKTLKIVGIIDQKDKFPNELSGGQQQRVAIARAIVDEPKIIVADEPTGNLDPKNAIIIMEILNKINLSGATIVMATHDVGIVNKYKKRVVLVKDGYVANESEGVYIYE